MRVPPVHTCKVAKIYKLRIEHMEENVGSLQTLFTMRLLGCKPKNYVENSEKGQLCEIGR